MAVHLLAYLKEQFSPAVVDQLSNELNETPANTLKAINGTLPILLGGLPAGFRHRAGLRPLSASWIKKNLAQHRWM